MKYDATTSDTVTRIMKKPLIKGYNIIIKRYGVDVDIYLPDLDINALNGYLDDSSNNKNLVPYFQGKVYIPSMYRRRLTTNLAALDPFVDSEQFLYVASDKQFILNSLVVCRLQSKKILNYRIYGNAEVGNDSGRIIQRYEIVPVTSINPVINESEVKEAVKAEKENSLGTFNQQENDFNSKKWNYKPLK